MSYEFNEQFTQTKIFFNSKHLYKIQQFTESLTLIECSTYVPTTIGFFIRDPRLCVASVAQYTA